MSEQSLFIKLNDDGRPQTHPILEQNLQDLIVDFDPKNPPKGFVKFIKTPVPELGPYERYDYLDYAHSPELSELYGQETWHEVHHIMTLSVYDRNEVINKFKRMNPYLNDWVYDERTHNLVPPVPKPTDGKDYFWNVDVKAWQENKPSLYFDEILELAKVIGVEVYNEKGLKPEELTNEEFVKKMVGMITIGK